MGFSILVVGLLVFYATHSFVTLRAARAAAMKRVGQYVYRTAFALVSIIGIVLIAWGFARYRQAGMIVVWHPPDFMRHITILLMWPAIVLVTAAYLPGHIKRAVKHPMLSGVKLWAFAHLLANGDLGGIVLFGSFLAWAVYDRIAVRRREAVGDVTNVGFADGGWTNDIIAVVLGTLLFFALGFTFHPAIIGIPVFGR